MPARRTGALRQVRCAAVAAVPPSGAGPTLPAAPVLLPPPSPPPPCSRGFSVETPSRAAGGLHPSPVLSHAAADTAAFNFDAYVMKQAKLVEKALSDSVPQQYPDTIHEAPSLAFLTPSLHHSLRRSRPRAGALAATLPRAPVSPSATRRAALAGDAVLSAGRWEAHPADALPGRLRARRRRPGCRHAHGAPRAPISRPQALRPRCPACISPPAPAPQPHPTTPRAPAPGPRTPPGFYVSPPKTRRRAPWR